MAAVVPLIDVDALDDGGRQFAQIGRAAPGAGAGATRQRAAGVQHGHAVDVDAGRLLPLPRTEMPAPSPLSPAIERDARHAGNRFIDILIGEFADILGG